MTDEEIDTIEQQATEALYSLEVTKNKDFPQEIKSIIYKAYVSGKAQGNQDFFKA